MKQLSNLRKAGPGETLTRWVKLSGRGEKQHVTSLAPADAIGTRFPTRVIRPSDMKAILVSGHSNIKIGRDVRKGALRGYWLYTLSLEERATCPSTCQHWRSCFGNAMPFAKRVDHTDAEFLPRLAEEIERLLSVLGRRGILIRLHALGDFYSENYVGFWRSMLLKHDKLAIFGYTAYEPDSDIGIAVRVLRARFNDRAMIRFSNGGLDEMCAISTPDAAAKPEGAFICPEQTGGTRCCATCAACWSTTKNVAFLDH